MVWTMRVTDAGGMVEFVRLMSMLTLTRVKPSALQTTKKRLRQWNLKTNLHTVA